MSLTWRVLEMLYSDERPLESVGESIGGESDDKFEEV